MCFRRLASQESRNGPTIAPLPGGHFFQVLRSGQKNSISHSVYKIEGQPNKPIWSSPRKWGRSRFQCTVKKKKKLIFMKLVVGIYVSIGQHHGEFYPSPSSGYRVRVRNIPQNRLKTRQKMDIFREKFSMMEIKMKQTFLWYIFEVVLEFPCNKTVL